MSTDQWTHVVIGGPWPERIGLRCRIVPNPGPGSTYPWDHDADKYPLRNDRGAEAVVLIEDDPLTAARKARYPNMSDDDRWTCVMNVSSLSERRACTTESCDVSGPPDWMHVTPDGSEWCPDHCPDCHPTDPGTRSETTG